jgi:hypothetical protein
MATLTTLASPNRKSTCTARRHAGRNGRYIAIRIRSVVIMTEAHKTDTANTGRKGGLSNRLFAKKYIPKNAITVGTNTVDP